MGRPLWRVIQTHVEAWRQMVASAHMCRGIQFGIYEQPLHPSLHGRVVELGYIPQSEEALQFGTEDLRQGCASGIYQEVSKDHARRAL